MIDLAATIEAMKASGMTSDEIVRAIACLQISAPAPVVMVDEQAERRRAKDRERKRLRNSAEVVGIPAGPSPKESPQTPKETPPSTPKENPLRGQKKGSRLPDDFEPDFAFAESQGLSRSQAEGEFAKFRDYWTAKTGQGATKQDWQATWRNWVRTAAERMGPRQRAGPGKVTPLDLSRQLLDEMAAADARTSTEIGGHQQAPRLLFIPGGR